MILRPLQKLPKNVVDLGKLIVAQGFKKWPKVQKIVKSGHTNGIPANGEHVIQSNFYMSDWIQSAN